MTPEREAEVFAKLDLLLEMQRRTEADVREIRAELRDVRGVVRDAQRAIAELDSKLGETNARLARVDGRVEEPSKFLRLVLAGRQSRRTEPAE